MRLVAGILALAAMGAVPVAILAALGRLVRRLRPPGRYGPPGS